MGAGGLCRRLTVAVRTDGTLWAWGSNAGGRLGDGTTTTRRIPVQLGRPQIGTASPAAAPIPWLCGKTAPSGPGAATPKDNSAMAPTLPAMFQCRSVATRTGRPSPAAKATLMPLGKTAPCGPGAPTCLASLVMAPTPLASHRCRLALPRTAAGPSAGRLTETACAPMAPSGCGAAPTPAPFSS